MVEKTAVGDVPMSGAAMFPVAAAAAAAVAATSCIVCNRSATASKGSAVAVLNLLQDDDRAKQSAPAPGTYESYLRISIPNTVADSDGGTLFEIHCANGAIKWTTRRRYKEFRALLRELMGSDRHDRLELSFLPQLPRRYKGVKKRSPEVVAARRDGLQLFLRAASAVPGIASDPHFLRFVGFEEAQHGQTGGAVRRMRQHTVAEMGHRMATLQRAGSAVLMADLVEDDTPPKIQGELLLRLGDSNTFGYRQFWCEMRGPAIFWYGKKGDPHPVGSFSYDAGSTVSKGIPSTVRHDTIDTLPNCLTVETADPGHYIILSVPKDAHQAWYAVILDQQGHREEAEQALGAEAKRWSEQAADVPVTTQQVGEQVLALFQKREQEEQAKRRARRRMFLLQDDDDKS